MKKKKKKIVYIGEDKGQTIYSMAALDGKTPEEVEEEAKRRNTIYIKPSERRAMISAAFRVYGPIFLICVGAFAVAILLAFIWLSC